MRWSKYYLPTYKEVPADAEIPSHQLMLRAGMIRKLTSGVYSFLPAGFKVLKRVEDIVRQEMDRAGGQEIVMPVLHPSELYEETGRLANFGELLFKLHDRRNRFFALGPTHEEVVTDIARAEMRSYRQLPQTLYQIQVKFRDEFRPRFGLMRAREFVMKDAYSFHESQESLTETYEVMGNAYARILERCGLDSVKVEAESGAIGGDVNHEFVVLAESGESEIFVCENCSFAANDERMESKGKTRKTVAAAGKPERVDTPGKSSIEDVSAFMKVDATALVKTLLVKTADSGKVVAALLPGERELSEVKLAKYIGGDYEMLGDDEIESLTGAKVGFAGPVGLPDSVDVVADPLLEGYDGMIVGANETDAHLRGVKMGRDFTPNAMASVSVAQAGDSCIRCGEGTLTSHRGVELGHIFKLDTKYSTSMSATFQDEEGNDRPFIMGCYGFGVSRAVAAAVEQHNDEKGIRWPKPLTPFHAIVTPVMIAHEESVEVGEKIYGELEAKGMDVLFDDRDARPGVKFKDAELVGVPVRVTIGERNLKNGNVEIYYRLEDKTDIVPVEDAVAAVEAYYR